MRIHLEVKVSAHASVQLSWGSRRKRRFRVTDRGIAIAAAIVGIVDAAASVVSLLT